MTINSNHGLEMVMGDNLYIARQFSALAMADMSEICAMDTPPMGEDAVKAMQLKLSTMQSGAKDLRAKAIYQSAQDVIDILGQPKLPANIFETRISGLSRLVRQYESGLSDVEAQMAEIATGADVDRLPDSRAPQMDEAQAYNAAKLSLTELLPLAKGNELTALNHLMNYDPDADIEVEAEARAIIPPVKHSDAAQIPLEYVLRDVIQDALSIARTSGKTISVSYDVGQKYMPEGEVLSLEKRLCEGLRALILQSLPQDGVGHLDISLEGQNVIITCKYPAPRLMPKGLESQVLETGCKLSLPLQAPVQYAIGAPSEPLPSQEEGALETQPMITPENEQSLRAQLHGLMDWPNAIPNTLGEDEPVPGGVFMDDNITAMADLTLENTAKDAMTEDRITGHKANKDELGAGL